MVLGGCLAIASVLNTRYESVLLLFAAHAQETPAEALAAQIRRQGYRCDGSLNAERDAERSRPNEAVWVLKCENATYRIRLVPNMAAHVEPLG
jgi:hypothetical protein